MNPSDGKYSTSRDILFVARGAEAVVEIFSDIAVKTRIPKRYRLKEIDTRMRKNRTFTEARIMSEARRIGIPTPIIKDLSDYVIVMNRVHGRLLKDCITTELCERVGALVGLLHKGGMIHGDLTTSNMILSEDGRIYMIDFGLSFFDTEIESRGVDVHVLFQTLKSTHDGYEDLTEAFKKGYRPILDCADDVLNREREIEKRGRYL